MNLRRNTSPRVYAVVSRYSDGDRIIEAVFSSFERAKRAAASVRDFRQDQDEAPVVTVEDQTK